MDAVNCPLEVVPMHLKRIEVKTLTGTLQNTLFSSFEDILLFIYFSALGCCPVASLHLIINFNLWIKLMKNVLIILVIIIFSYTVNASLSVCYLLNYFVFFISNTHRNLRDTWNEMKATMWRNINYVSSSLYFYGNSAWCCILMCILMSIFLNVSHACCPWMSRTMIIRLRDSAVNL